jgi:hypothetical protein
LICTYSILGSIGAFGSRSNGQRKKGREGSPAGRNSDAGALVVDGGGAPVVPGVEENTDAMKKGSASSKTWSASPISFCVEVEERLESAAAADVVEVLEALRFKTNRRR